MSGDQPLRFGFSPCPNDTFAFWGAVHGKIDAPLAFAPVMADIEALNERAVQGHDDLEVTKLSLPALARCLDRYVVLPSGAALGFGCGPLVVCRDPSMQLADLANARVAIPGEHTTAFLLMASLLPTAGEVVAMRFDEILGAVADGACDAGLIIHESRFTYAQHGLRELADLGVLWERETGGPLPLGIIAARRDLGRDRIRAIGDALRKSVRLARSSPEQPRSWIRQHAQEMADDVCDQHIALYVNDFSENLGAVGSAAVVEILRRGRTSGLLPEGGLPFVDDDDGSAAQSAGGRLA